MPPIDRTGDDKFVAKIIICAACALLVFVLLLFLMCIPAHKQTNSEGGGRGTSGTGTGSQAGEGNGGAKGNSPNDHEGNDSDVGNTGGKSQASDSTTESTSETNPFDGKQGHEIPPSPDTTEGQPTEATSVSETPSLGEQIAANLSNPPPKPQTEEASGGESGGGGEGVTVRVFGLAGHGTKFMYVFDRSGSMSGAKLAESKKELLGSLSVLTDKHQFNIVFYDSYCNVWKPERKLITANPTAKKDAEEYVQRIATQGGTDHRPALLEAIAHGPEVIFFLIDGQSLTERELDEITQQSGNICINVIQLADPGEGKSEILRQFAIRNHGR